MIPGLRRPVAVAATLVVVVLSTLVGPLRPVGVPAAAQESDRTPLEPRVVELVGLTTFVAPDGVLELAFRLDDVAPGATVELALHPRVQNRIRFAETVAGLRLGSPLRSFDDLPAAQLPRGEDGVVRLSLQLVPSGEPPLAGITVPSQGVYPLSLTVLDPEGQEIDRLIVHVVRLPAVDEDPEAVPLATGLVVPVSAPTALRSDGSAELDTASARQITEATEALNAHPDVPVSLVPTPETVDGLEPAGHDDLESALAEAATGREVLASTYVPLDAASWNALDGPVTIGSQLDAGEDALTARLGVPADRSTGLLSPLVDPPALATLVDLGTERLVVPEPLLDPLDPSDFPVTMTQTFDVVDGAGRRVPAVQADAALEGHVRSTDQPALAANRTLADLGVLYFDLPLVARGAVLRIGPEDAAVLGPVLEGLAVAADAPPGASALLAPDTLPGLFEHMTRAPAPESEGEGEGEDDEVLVRGWVASGPRPLGDLPERRAEAVATIDAYRTMVGTDDDAVRRARRLVRVADDVRLGPEGTPGPQDYLDGATTVIGGRLGAIRAPEQGAVTLTASDASVPVAIDNGLDVPVRVQLHLRSEKLDFPDGSPIEVTLAPGPNRIEVHVRARASGVFPLEVSVTSLDGAIELSDARVRVRSAAVSGLGVVLSVGAGAFLCVWWARNWRKARRARSLVSPSHPALRTAGGGRSGDTRPRG